MSLRLSEKHGVNPSIQQCFVCMKDMGVVLFGKINTGRSSKPADRDPRAPYKVCLDQEPCDECKKHMETGIILISADEKKSDDLQNPYRTGGWVVVKEAAVRRFMKPGEALDAVLKKRMAFVTDETWDALGLPRKGQDDVRLT